MFDHLNKLRVQDVGQRSVLQLPVELRGLVSVEDDDVAGAFQFVQLVELLDAVRVELVEDGHVHEQDLELLQVLALARELVRILPKDYED